MKECADLNPDNWLPRQLILEAEKLRLELPDSLKILQLYEQASILAESNGFFQIAAIASERASSFLMSNGLIIGCTSYQDRAQQLYAKWGARSKCQQISSSTRVSNSESHSINSIEGDFGLHNTILNHVTEILTNEMSTHDSITVFCEVT
jgi:hypothetical protein